MNGQDHRRRRVRDSADNDSTNHATEVGSNGRHADPQLRAPASISTAGLGQDQPNGSSSSIRTIAKLGHRHSSDLYAWARHACCGAPCRQFWQTPWACTSRACLQRLDSWPSLPTAILALCAFFFCLACVIYAVEMIPGWRMHSLSPVPALLLPDPGEPAPPGPDTVTGRRPGMHLATLRQIGEDIIRGTGLQAVHGRPVCVDSWAERTFGRPSLLPGVAWAASHAKLAQSGERRTRDAQGWADTTRMCVFGRAVITDARGTVNTEQPLPGPIHAALADAAALHGSTNRGSFWSDSTAVRERQEWLKSSHASYEHGLVPEFGVASAVRAAGSKRVTSGWYAWRSRLPLRVDAQALPQELRRVSSPVGMEQRTREQAVEDLLELELGQRDESESDDGESGLGGGGEGGRGGLVGGRVGKGRGVGPGPGGSGTVGQYRHEWQEEPGGSNGSDRSSSSGGGGGTGGGGSKTDLGQAQSHLKVRGEPSVDSTPGAEEQRLQQYLRHRQRHGLSPDSRAKPQEQFQLAKGGSVALVTRPFQPGILRHWLVNGYLPALDAWIELGSPRPFTLVQLVGGEGPLRDLRGGGRRQGLWPADGFGEHDTVLVGAGEEEAGWVGQRRGPWLPGLPGSLQLSTAWSRGATTTTTNAAASAASTVPSSVWSGQHLGVSAGFDQMSCLQAAAAGARPKLGPGTLCVSTVVYGMPPSTPVPYTPLDIRARTAATARQRAWDAAGVAPWSDLVLEGGTSWAHLIGAGKVPLLVHGKEQLLRSMPWLWVPHAGRAAVPTVADQRLRQAASKWEQSGPKLAEAAKSINAARLQAWEDENEPQSFESKKSKETRKKRLEAAGHKDPADRILRVLWCYSTDKQSGQSGLLGSLQAVLGERLQRHNLPTAEPWGVQGTRGDDGRAAASVHRATKRVGDWVGEALGLGTGSGNGRSAATHLPSYGMVGFEDAARHRPMRHVSSSSESTGTGKDKDQAGGQQSQQPPSEPPKQPVPSPLPVPRRVRLDVRLTPMSAFTHDQMVRLAHAADIVVAAHGPDITSAFWMRGRGTQLVELFPRGTTSGWFAGLVAAAGVGHQQHLGIHPKRILGGEEGGQPGRFGAGTVHLPPSHAVALMGEAIGRALVPSLAAQEDAMQRIKGQAERASEFSTDFSCAPRLDMWAERTGDCVDSRAWQRWEQPAADQLGWSEAALKQSRGPPRILPADFGQEGYLFDGATMKEVQAMQKGAVSDQATEEELGMTGIIAQNGRGLRWAHQDMHTGELKNA